MDRYSAFQRDVPKLLERARHDESGKGGEQGGSAEGGSEGASAGGGEEVGGALDREAALTAAIKRMHILRPRVQQLTNSTTRSLLAGDVVGCSSCTNAAHMLTRCAGKLRVGTHGDKDVKLAWSCQTCLR